MKMRTNEKGKAMTKLASGLLAIALVSVCAVAQLGAQKDAPKSNDHASDTTATTTYRLTYTVTELDGQKQVGVQHYSLTVNADNSNSQFKLGSRVPIATGSYGADGGLGHTEIQYQDVGLNIAARIHEFTGGVEVYSKLEQTSVAEEQSSVGLKDPVIRQAVLQNTALLTAGKPVMLGSLDVPGSTRHLDIEVVLEPVR
jgi:type II secretory pathway component GspD/PulD (secretin)